MYQEQQQQCNKNFNSNNSKSLPVKEISSVDGHHKPGGRTGSLLQPPLLSHSKVRKLVEPRAPFYFWQEQKRVTLYRVYTGLQIIPNTKCTLYCLHLKKIPSSHSLPHNHSILHNIYTPV